MATNNAKATDTKAFKKGDQVTWYSSHTQKTGKVIAVIDPLENPSHKINALVHAGTHRSNFGFGQPREHKSYLIEVSSVGPRYPGGKTPKAVLFWPVVSLLKKID